MINLERDQKCFKTYTSFLFQAEQEVHGIYCYLNNTKLQLDSYLNHLTGSIVTNEQMDLSFGRVLHVKCGVIHKILNILFRESDNLVH